MPDLGTLTMTPFPPDPSAVAPAPSRPCRRRRSDLVGMFLDEAGRVPLLDAADEAVLARLLRHPDSSVAREARDRLWVGNLRFAVFLAARFRGRGLDMEDLIAHAALGLLRAIEGYDPDTGYRLTTYARASIVQSIQRGIAADSGVIRLPHNAAEALIKRNRGRALDRREAGYAAAAARVLASSSLDDEAFDPSKLDRLIDHRVEPAGSLAERSEEVQCMRRGIEAVAGDGPDGARMARAMTLRYGLDDGGERTLDEIARDMGISREWARVWAVKGVERLREMLVVGDGRASGNGEAGR